MLTTVVFGTLLLVRLMWVLPQLMQFIGALVPRAQPALAGAQQRLYAVLPGLDTSQPSRLFLIVYIFFSLIGLALLSVTGYLGGALVYDHGVGIPPLR